MESESSMLEQNSHPELQSSEKGILPAKSSQRSENSFESSKTNSVPNNSPLESENLNDTSPSEKPVDESTMGKDVLEDAAGILPMGTKLIMITVSLMLGFFCTALDNTITSVAIPRITDEFHALNDVGWYASSYLLTSCSFQLLFGKVYARYSVKWVFLSALFIFEVGSLICAVAPNSTTLIVGRAVAGVGSAGIFTGALITIAITVPLHRRPTFLAFIGGIYGISSVAGPLVRCFLPCFGRSLIRPSARWCVYRSCNLEMVLLHKSSTRRCMRRRHFVPSRSASQSASEANVLGGIPAA